MLLSKYIPMQMIAQMPRPFVYRLRDMRTRQIEKENKLRQQQMGINDFTNNTNVNGLNYAQQVFDGSTIDRLVEELSDY